jgi:hypothetical protein
MRPMQSYVLRKFNMSHTEAEMSLVLLLLILLFPLLHLYVRYQTADFSTAYRMYL